MIVPHASIPRSDNALHLHRHFHCIIRVKAQRLAQFGQRHVRLALEMLPDGGAVLGNNELLVSGEVLDAASLATLLEQLFNHAQGDAKTRRAISSRVPSPFVIRADDALT